MGFVIVGQGGILHEFDLDVSRVGFSDQFCQLLNRKLLGKLIEGAVFPPFPADSPPESQCPRRVPDIQLSPFLVSCAMHGERMA